eukprot:scaffold612_cov98-Cylindrotheca_fusiformis.AAC.1
MAPAIISINRKEEQKVSPMREPEFGGQNRELYAKYCQQEQSIENLRSKYKDAKQRMDQMRTEGVSQKKLLLEMNDVVRALHEVSMEYEQIDSSNGFQSTLSQIANKIRAIDKELKTSMLHSVQIQELKKIASSTIMDQEEKIKALEDQISLMSARKEHSDSHKDILLPDTSYEAQISTMKQTIDSLQAKVKRFESDKRYNNISALKEGLRVAQNSQDDAAGGVIDLTDVSDGQPVSITKDNQSYSTQELTSHHSSYEEEFKAARERADELESENQKLIEAMEQAMEKMTKMSKSASVQEKQLESMKQAIEQTKKENATLKKANLEAKNKIAKMSGDVEEAEAIKADFQELERTVISRVQELEKENSELKIDQQHATSKIVELSNSVADSEHIKGQLEDEIKRLQKQNVDSASRIEELSTGAAEGKQVKTDFQTLQRTVIARVEELQIENQNLKQNQEDESWKRAQVQKEIDEARDYISDLEKENTNLKETMDVMKEENHRLTEAATAHLKEENASLKKHKEEAAAKILSLTEEISQVKEECEGLKEENARLRKDEEGAAEKIQSLTEEISRVKVEADELHKARAEVEYLEEENYRLRAAKTVDSDSQYDSEDLQRSQYDSEDLQRSQDDAEDLQRSAAMVVELEFENQRLRETMMSEEEAQKLRDDHRELEEKLAQVNVSLASLQAEHGRTLMRLEEPSKSKSAQGMSEDEMAQYKKNMESYESLKKLHNAVVMKLADLGEENGALKDQLAATEAKLSDQKEASFVLATIKKDYAKLMNQYEAAVAELNARGRQTENLRNDYSKLVDQYEKAVEKLNARGQQTDGSMSMLQQHYADARAQIAVLTWENEELRHARESYNDVEAKITVLERQLAESNQDLDAEKQKSAERLKHLKEVIAAYKQLDTDYQEVCEKLRKLRALMEGETKATETDSNSSKKKKKKKKGSSAKIELLENQRNAAWEQMRDLEKSLTLEKQRASKATVAKAGRENDLQVVLKEYEALQALYEKALKRVDGLKAKNQDLKKRLAEQKKKVSKKAKAEPKVQSTVVEDDFSEEEPIEIIVLDDRDYFEEIIEEEEEVEEEEQKEEEEEEALPMSHKDELKAIWKKFGIAKEESVSGDSVVAPADVAPAVDVPSDDETPFDEPANNNTAPRAKEPKNQNRINQEVHVMDSAFDVMSTISNDLQPLMQQLDDGKNEELHELEQKHKEALDKLAKMERELLVAQKEAVDAKKTQVAREVHLRDSAAKLFQLEREHKELQGVVSSLKSQVAKAKKEVGAAQAETEEIRTQLETSKTQFQELQESHDLVCKKLKTATATKKKKVVSKKPKTTTTTATTTTTKKKVVGDKEEKPVVAAAAAASSEKPASVTTEGDAPSTAP